MADYGTQLNHEGRISSLEKAVETLTEQIDKLESIDKSLTKLTLLFEESQRSSAKRDEFIENQNKLLLQVIEDSQDTKDSVEELELKVDDLIVKVNESEKKNIISIDTRDVIKKVVTKFILPIGGFVAIVFEILKLLKVI